jgi:hypothetical protein
MRPAGQPLPPRPGGVTPSRDGQARILDGRWSRLLAACGCAALADWTAGSAAVAHDLAAASELPEPPVAGGVWAVDGGEHVAVVASPCLPAPVGPDLSVTNRGPPEGGYFCGAARRLPVSGSGQDPQTRPSRGEGARVEDDGSAGNRPQSDAAPRGPGRSLGATSCAGRQRRAARAAPDHEAVTAGWHCRSWWCGKPRCLPQPRDAASPEWTPGSCPLAGGGLGAGPSHGDGGPALGRQYRRRGLEGPREALIRAPWLQATDIS